ncbi:MAG: 30S ribosomal protein S5 [Candidatus Woesearchaeota archaeon]
MVEKEESKKQATVEVEEYETDEKAVLDAKKDTLKPDELDEEKIEQDSVKKRQMQQLEKWHPKTELGKKIKSGEITDIDEIFRSGQRILEVEIIDTLFPNIESELLMIGQSKGKFGGGARRVFKQTQKKTKEGNKPSFATIAVVGNKDGYVGIGYGKAKETVPAREKALSNAKLNLFQIKRGSGSWLSSTTDPHSIPFAVSGKCGSVKITLMPAPVGKGLVIEKECRKILQLAGIKDIWSNSSGHTKTKINLIKACISALRKLNVYKVSSEKEKELSIITGNKRQSD